MRDRFQSPSVADADLPGRRADDRPGRGEGDAAVDGRRRRLLRAIGAVSAAGLAGCTEEGNDGRTVDPRRPPDADGPPPADRDLPDVDVTYYGVTTVNPVETGFNPTRGDIPWESVGAVGFQTLRDDRGERPQSLLSDVSVSDTEIALTFRETGWSNGEPVLGEDLYVAHKIDRLAADRSFATVAEEGPDAVREAIEELDYDGRTCYLRSPNGYFGRFNRRFLREMAIPARLVRNRFQYREWLDRMEAIDDPWSDAGRVEIEGIRAEIRERSYDDPAAELLTNGAFQLEEVTDRQYIMAPNEHHYNADLINWPRLVFDYVPSESSRKGALMSGSVDGVNALRMTESAFDDLPDEIYPYPVDRFRGRNLVVNHEHEWLGRTEVRQAIAHAIDREALSRSVNGFATEGVEVPCAIHDAVQATWLGDLRGAFDAYEGGDDRVAALLESAGLSREGGSWVTPDGETLSFTLTADINEPTYAQTVAAHLSRAGIDVGVDTVESTTYQQKLRGGTFEAAIGWWGRGNRNPGRALRLFARLLELDRSQWINYGYWDRATKEDLVENTRAEWSSEGGPGLANLTPELVEPFTVDAPPVGDPSGDLREYPAASLSMRLPSLADEDDYREAIRTLAWLVNYDLPILPLTAEFDVAYQNVRDWVTPAADSADWQRYPLHLVNEGAVRANPDGRGGAVD